MNALDRPIWHALNTRHAHLAEGDGRARRYRPDISVFGCAASDSREDAEALGRLLPPGQSMVLLQATEAPHPSGLTITTDPAVQMVATAIEAPGEASRSIERLGAADAAEMLALATLTKPGPFLPRTHEMGRFFGIRVDGRLAAMAGERMALPGRTEVSGVCTHPDFRGRGYAALLSRFVAARMLARGEQPFLHAYAGNEAAIRLYRRLGFELRRQMVVTVWHRE